MLLRDGGVAAFGWNLYGQCGQIPSGCCLAAPIRVSALDAGRRTPASIVPLAPL